MTEYFEKALAGEQLSREDALALAQAPLEPLCAAADELRARFCGNRFDLCTIINGKSGLCSENCKYCAQSARHPVGIESYPLLDTETLAAGAAANEAAGILRYSVVTSGRALTDAEVGEICASYREIGRRCRIALCASHGLLTYPQFVKLREAGVRRYHNNLETSRRNFPNICTTHTYDDKLAAIRAAQRAGLEVCSGGILGLGETMEDRVDMALELRALGIRSAPINVLNPIPGTPLGHLPTLPEDEVRRTVAVFRFLLPDADLRLAGGRGLMPDKGAAVFRSGANAAISGDMLTTSGIRTADDLAMLGALGFEVRMP